jgi:hypothetical protein
MKTTSSFLRFAAICAFISAITTLGIHLLFPEFSSDFNERLQLYHNGIYILNRWWIITHCLLIIISMWGFYLAQSHKSPGFTGLGFTFFVVFAVAEIMRQLLVLFYLNGLRIKYLATDNVTIREILRLDIENFSLIGNSLFGLFILSFAIGNLCFGLSLWKESGFSKLLAWLFVLWSLGNITTLQLEFIPNTTLNEVIGIYSYIYQPLMRGVIGVWLWKQSSNLAKT